MDKALSHCWGVTRRQLLFYPEVVGLNFSPVEIQAVFLIAAHIAQVA